MSKTFLIAFVSMIAGIVLWGGFNTFMEKTNTLSFCISCHEMKSTVYQEYKQSKHYQNASGVRAICSDCHVPKDWTHKLIRKVQATRELYHWAVGSINTQEKFQTERYTLAKREWKRMRDNDSRECRNCHSFEAMAFHEQTLKASRAMQDAYKKGKTCIDCHKGIAHQMPDINKDNRTVYQTLLQNAKTSVRSMPDDKTVLFSKAIFVSTNADKLGRVVAGATVKTINVETDFVQIRFNAWRRQALPAKLYTAPERRQMIAQISASDDKSIRVLKTVEPADSSYIWEQVEVSAWTDKGGLSIEEDRIEEYAAKLYDDNCTLCHTKYKANAYSANDWIGHFNAMKRLTPMQEHEADMLLFYLQNHAKS
ncbi:MAG: NapC/NirT family cytochrome c [Methylocystaceae bacterium]|nr:NapC/NirT family cytochrome c [Methylocystaceae bacterium]